MKRFLKKALVFVISAVMLVSSLSLFACSEVDLKIFNCYDYIDEDLIKSFKEYYKEKTGKDIKIQYTCYDTPEELYNILKMKGSDYDLVCPSDYMIEKMAREDMLQEVVLPADGAYRTNVSPFIDEKFKSVTWGDGENLSKYAAGYMWGTLGLCYDPEKVDAEDMDSWSSLWTNKYKNKFSIKDSVRDTYFIGLAKKFATELEDNKAYYTTDYDRYYATLKNIFNDTTEGTVNAMESVLRDLIDNSACLEVDEGKDKICKGDTDIYFAWSGDAVYAMDTAEEDFHKTLKYSVPKEGSNIWLDGWCIPKTAKHYDLAIEFIEFMSTPENVIQNMEYIGYVSCVGGDEVFDWVAETYGSDEGALVADLGYFFDAEGTGDYTVKYEEEGSQFTAQYPTEDVVKRCVMMNYFPDAANERVNKLWIKVRG